MSTTSTCCGRTPTTGRCRPIERASSGHRRYGGDDLARIGVVICLRDADLGVADLRPFIELLRTERADDRVAFLRRRREELLDRVRRT